MNLGNTNGTVTVQLGYKGPTGSSIIPIGRLVHEKSEISSSVNQPTTHSHWFLTSDVNYVDQTLRDVSLQSTPSVQVRIGTVQGHSTLWLPWQDHILSSFNARHNTGGHLVAVTTTDAFGRMNRSSYTRPFRGKISDIIGQIATDNGLKSIIEETVGTGSYIQSNITDSEFILRLLPRAINASGVAGFRVFVKDNILHFHSTTYQASFNELDPLTKDDLVLSGEVQGAVQYGGSGSTYCAVDPYEGEAYYFSSSRSRSIRFGNEMPAIHELGPTSQALHPSTNRLEEIRTVAQSRFDFSRGTLFTVKVILVNGISATAGDMIRLKIVPPGSSQSPWSGLYPVNGVEHTLRNGDSQTLLRLQRGEIVSSTQDFSRVDGAIRSSTAADGHSVNLDDVINSEKTKGPADGSLVKVVQVV